MRLRTIHAKSYAGDAAGTTEVDLSLLGGSGDYFAQLVFHPADFDIEVVGNDAAVTVEGTGPFTSSGTFDVTGGSFAIGGGKVAVQGFALKDLVFTTVGGAYTINIIRAVE